MSNCLHCSQCSSCHKFIQSLNDSPCYSNQQQPSPSSFICSACVASSIPFFNLTNTEFYNLLLFDNSDLSNFLKFFACDLLPQHYQTKYSTLNDTGKMNHANKPENFKLDDFFQMTEVNIYTNICDEKKQIMLELLFMIFLIIYQFL